MKSFASLLILLTLGLCGSVRAERLLMAFSANLEASGGCHRDDPSGADLYTVVLDLEEMKVGELTRITDKPSQAEWFSSISPDGRLVLFNYTRFAPRFQDTLVYDRKTGQQHVLLRGARFPHWHSNTEFYYTSIRGRHDCHYAKLTWKGTDIEIAESRPITRVVTRLQWL